MKLNLNQLWKVLSLLVPVPEGYAVGIAIWRVLNWDIRIVVVSSIIVALTGFLAIDITNRMSEFNDTLSEEEKNLKMQAPTWRGLVVLAIWFAGVTLLTVFLEVVPGLATWTPLGLVVVGSSAAWLRSINKGQDAREESRELFRAERKQESSKQEEQARKLEEEKRNERKAARKARQEARNREATIKQAIAARLQGNLGSLPAQKSGAAGQGNDAQTPIAAGRSQLTDDQRQSDDTSSRAKIRAARKAIVSDEQLIFEYQLTPTISSGDLAQKFGVSRQAIDQRRNALADAGILDLVKDDKGRVARVDVILIAVGQGS